MGGLGKQMPVVRTVFVIGALGLAGIPIFNGFWSKELILEAGLSGGPLWMFAIMVFSAGVTALYTFRCVWLVFFGENRGHLHGHEAGTAMKVALIPLAFGTLVSWLLAGPFGKFLDASLPFHLIRAEDTGAVLLEVLTAPATWVALLVVVLGLAAWWYREKLRLFSEILAGVGRVAEKSFGFEAINQTVVDVVSQAAEDLRGSQTGLLNWNVMAIIIALGLVIAILALGA
jgi:NADH-quinone oxidoreductase subunit L